MSSIVAELDAALTICEEAHGKLIELLKANSEYKIGVYQETIDAIQCVRGLQNKIALKWALALQKEKTT